MSFNLKWIPFYQQQVDVLLNQSNPVSTTFYPVLPTTVNARLESIGIYVVWATNQPSELRVSITIDGKTISHHVANPLNATLYYPQLVDDTAVNQLLATTFDILTLMALSLLEGKSVKVDASTTWAVTQPSALVCRLKYAKLI